MDTFKIVLATTDLRLRDVKTKLKEAGFGNAKWRKLGEELGLRKGTLDVIETNHPRDADRCCEECLEKWLQRADDVDKCHGMPTYSSLADALDKIDQKDVADKIRKYIAHMYFLNIKSPPVAMRVHW